MKLPDKRYTVNLEWCGHETRRYVPRFCGEWLRDSVLWPDRAGNQSPSFNHKANAIAACCDYERQRQILITQGIKQQAHANFYECNKESI